MQYDSTRGNGYMEELIEYTYISLALLINQYERGHISYEVYIQNAAQKIDFLKRQYMELRPSRHKEYIRLILERCNEISMKPQ